MLRSRFLWKLCASYAAVILISVGAIGVLTALQIAHSTLDEIQLELQGKAFFLRDMALASLQRSATGDLQDRIKLVGTENRERLTVLLADGRVLADSRRDPSTMDNHADRSEIQEARETGSGTTERHSKTLNTRMMYFALAVLEEGRLIGFVRSALSLKKVDERLSGLRARVVSGGLAAVILGLAIGFFLARRVTRPIVSMTNEAKALAAGEQGSKVEAYSHDEVGSLAQAFNAMADALRDRMETITEDRNKVVAILRSMMEGVVAVDADERIVQINSVAARVLRTSSEESAGRRIWEVTRLHEVRSIVSETLESGREASKEIRIPEGPNDRVIVVHASPIRAGRGDAAGAVVLLHDVTEQRKLETMRRDFVANVSHELKTPLTAIRGMIETLVDDPEMEPRVRRRFLTKAEKQSERLNALLTDLLSLSRIETQEDHLAKRHLDLRDPILESVQRYEPEAEAKGLSMKKDLSLDPIPVHADPGAIVQAVDNLLQNAVRYTPEGGTIRIRVRREEETAVLEVEDTGMGIEPRHHDRLFERFYRVDNARSRELGGTGLGLSIVKHIIQAHGGEVSLESDPGQGSIFRVSIPITEV